MNISIVKTHNENVKNAMNSLDRLYCNYLFKYEFNESKNDDKNDISKFIKCIRSGWLYRITEKSDADFIKIVEKNWGIIRSIKDIIMPKKCISKSIQRLSVQHDNVIFCLYKGNDTCYSFFNKGAKEYRRVIEILKAQSEKYQKLINVVEIDENYASYARIRKKLEEARDDALYAKKLGITMGIYGVIPDEKAREKALAEYGRLAAEISKIPNSEKNEIIYDMFSAKEQLNDALAKARTQLRQMIAHKKTIKDARKHFESELKVLEECIKKEKEIFTQKYPNADISEFPVLDEVKKFNPDNTSAWIEPFEKQNNLTISNFEKKYKAFRDYFIEKADDVLSLNN